jgi:hypothetical protein
MKALVAVAQIPITWDRLRCEEIWVVGADKWRNPDEDLPADFDQRRAENYAALRKPLDPKAFTGQMRAEMAEALADLNDHLPELDWVDIRERPNAAALRLVSSSSAGGDTVILTFRRRDEASS